MTKDTSMQFPSYQQITRKSKISLLPTSGDIHCQVIEREFIYMNEDKESSKLPAEVRNPFEPFPYSSAYSFEQMAANQKLRMAVNAIEILTKTIPIPKRKKKSWLRYTSNKKWNRKLTPKVIRVVGSKKVLMLPHSLFEKLKELSKLTKR